MRRNVITFYELSEQWQKEAISNLNDQAKGNMYLEPLDTETPEKHILWDLSECFPAGGFKGVIPISNNSVLKLYFNSDFTQAVMKFI